MDMDTTPSLKLSLAPAQRLQQMQHLMLLPKMQQALMLLQLPIAELEEVLDAEIAQNPLLEWDLAEDGDANGEEGEETLPLELSAEQPLSFDDSTVGACDDFFEEMADLYDEKRCFQSNEEIEGHSAFLENSAKEESSLFSHLLKQAIETFDAPGDRLIAEALIGNLDERGFLTVPLDEIASMLKCDLADLKRVLEAIRTFHPCGVGARGLQESLLIQLQCRGKGSTLAFEIVSNHYDDLLHNRIPAIKKALSCSLDDVRSAIFDEIVKLDLRPGAAVTSSSSIGYLKPDVTIYIEGEELKVASSQDALPQLRFNGRYLTMLKDDSLSAEDRDFISSKIKAARWLWRTLCQRKSTIERIAESLAKLQSEFFLSPQGNLQPLTMMKVAADLNLNESTVTRAVANKYMATPRGIFPLRFFFSQGILHSGQDAMSNNTAKELLMDLLAKEDKRRPLSDQDLSLLMETQGIRCARRTIAKYRISLNVGSAQQRRRFS